MADNTYSVGYSTNNRAKCKFSGCGETITKDELRFIKSGASGFSDKQAIQYYHCKCMFLSFVRARKTTKIITSMAEIQGLDTIKDNEKADIKKYLKQFKDGELKDQVPKITRNRKADDSDDKKKKRKANDSDDTKKKRNVKPKKTEDESEDEVEESDPKSKKSKKMTKSKKNSDSDESNPPKKSKNSVKPTDSRKVNVKSGKTTGNSKNTNVKSGKTNANSKNTNAKSGKAKSKKKIRGRI